MIRKAIQAKHLDDLQVLRFVHDTVADPSAPMPRPVVWWDFAERFYPDIPAKVVLAKLRQLLKRRLLDGCGCGCRGDFRLTEAGKTTFYMLALSPDHPIRSLPDDLRLYAMVAAQRACSPDQDDLSLMRWAYDVAREAKIPAEAVSKVLTLVRRTERENRLRRL